MFAVTVPNPTLGGLVYSVWAPPWLYLLPQGLSGCRLPFRPQALLRACRPGFPRMPPWAQHLCSLLYHPRYCLSNERRPQQGLSTICPGSLLPRTPIHGHWVQGPLAMAAPGPQQVIQPCSASRRLLHSQATAWSRGLGWGQQGGTTPSAMKKPGRGE